ncbi:MAG: hypothetical protein WBG04_14040 [Haloferula sp.]
MPAKVLADACAPALARWSSAREHSILKSGSRLPSSMLTFATEIGIQSPATIRLEIVDQVPLPLAKRWIKLAQNIGIPLFNPSGMCLGCGISATSADPALIRHELVHTLQFQRLGGHQGFMWHYLFECLRFGYAAAPLEIEARMKALSPPDRRA